MATGVPEGESSVVLVGMAVALLPTQPSILPSSRVEVAGGTLGEVALNTEVASL